MLVCPVAQFMEAVWGQVVEGEVGACGGGGSGADTQQQQQLARRVAQALAVVCLQVGGVSLAQPPSYPTPHTFFHLHASCITAHWA